MVVLRRLFFLHFCIGFFCYLPLLETKFFLFFHLFIPNLESLSNSFFPFEIFNYVFPNFLSKPFSFDFHLCLFRFSLVPITSFWCSSYNLFHFISTISLIPFIFYFFCSFVSLSTDSSVSFSFLFPSSC